MSDPSRISSSGTEVERGLLRRMADVEPPKGEKERVLLALQARIAGGGGGKGGGTSGPSGAGTRGRWVRLGVVGLAGVGALVLGARLLGTPAPSRAVEPTAVIAAPVSLPVQAPEPVRTPEPVPSASVAEVQPITPVVTTSVKVTRASPSAPAAASASVAPPPSAEPAPLAADQASRLREESELIARARSEVRAGYFAAALGTLDTARTRFPSGTLAQEREALTIEAMLKSGRKDEAKARLDAFAKENPESPHVARLSRLFSAPAP
jgi:hypothetical protein